MTSLLKMIDLKYKSEFLYSYIIKGINNKVVNIYLHRAFSIKLSIYISKNKGPMNPKIIY